MSLVAAGLQLNVDEWSSEEILSLTNVAVYGEHLDRVVLASLAGHSLPTPRLARSGAPVQFLSEESP